MESTTPEAVMNAGQAVQTTDTALGRMAAQCKTQRETIIAQWVAVGYTPAEAYNAALFGFRKS